MQNTLVKVPIVCLHWRHGIPLTPVAGAMLGASCPLYRLGYCAGGQHKISPMDQFICNFFSTGFSIPNDDDTDLGFIFNRIWSLETHLNKTAALVTFVISKWGLVCKFGVIFIISCLCSRFHVWNQWFFYSVITFSYNKCFVHSYTIDVVFTLSYKSELWSLTWAAIIVVLLVTFCLTFLVVTIIPNTCMWSRNHKFVVITQEANFQ